MTRSERKTIEALSTELFGGPSRYKRLFTKPTFVPKNDPVTGKTTRVAQWRSEEEAILLMKQLKLERDAQEKAKQLSKELGGSANS